MADLSKMLDEKESKNNATGSLVIAKLLLKARTDAHLSHLKQKNKIQATHEALGLFYEAVVDLVDTFIETNMGINDAFVVEEVEESKAIENPVQYFKDLYATIDKERIAVKESFIQNQVDEVQQLIAHTLFRLKFMIS